MINLYEIAAYITVGSVRSKNDDRISVCGRIIKEGSLHVESDCVLASVVDGVGGEAYGNEAAQLSAEVISMVYLNQFNAEISNAERIISMANDAVMTLRKTDVEHSQASAAISGVMIKDEKVICFNWGDSKVFLYRNNHILPKSKDHTLLQQMLDLGIPCPKLSRKTPLTGYLGCLPQKSDRPYYCSDIMEKNDIWLICSDGLSDYVSLNDMETVLKEEATLEKKCAFLVEGALKNHSDDNISLIIVKGE